MVCALLETKVMKEIAKGLPVKTMSMEDFIESQNCYVSTLALIVRRINENVKPKQINDEVSVHLKNFKV